MLSHGIGALQKRVLLISSCFLFNGSGDGWQKYCALQTNQRAACETVCGTAEVHGRTAAGRCRNVWSLDNHVHITH